MISTRLATRPDLAPMADVINPIIQAGGTTAFQSVLTPQALAAVTFDEPAFLFCFVALDEQGDVAGFQYLKRLSETEGDIASFTRQSSPLKGAGRALMAQTRTAARAAGLGVIQARIRADNVPGLGYYEAMGFRTVNILKSVPLADGTPIDRVIKRLEL